jgi:two-component system, response regulator PdtaR
MADKRVLIVEDEFIIAEALSVMIKDMGMQVCGRAADADRAVSLAHQHQPDLVLMDVRLKGTKDGVDAALAICATKSTPIIYITGSREPSAVARINTDHPAGILFKPIQSAELKEMIQQVTG